MKFIIIVAGAIFDGLLKCIYKCRTRYIISKFGYFDRTAKLRNPDIITCPHKVFVYENSHIFEGAIILINRIGVDGKLIIKKNTSIAQGLTVVTGTHERISGVFFKNLMVEGTHNKDRDVIIEEDVWIGANVTLLMGAYIGRGAHIGAGSVVRSKVPPYAIVLGNPSRVIGFAFTPNEIVEHEKKLYPEDERISLDVLEKNYNKYYVKKLDNISNFIK